MMPFETLAELFEIATAPWSAGPWANATPTTTDSIDRIQRELGIQVPEDFVRLSQTIDSGADNQYSRSMTRLSSKPDARKLPMVPWFQVGRH